MGSGIDAQKLQSSMTLFSIADPNQSIFSNVLNKYYGGKKDGRTLRMLGK